MTQFNLLPRFLFQNEKKIYELFLLYKEKYLYLGRDTGAIWLLIL